MFTPSDQVHGSPSSHIVVKKLADGRFEARNVSMPEVKVAVEYDEMAAIRQCAHNTERWIGLGCPVSVPELPAAEDE